MHQVPIFGERLLVTGGRKFTDAQFVRDTLDRFRAERSIAVLIHGCARGADSFADEWAKRRNVQVERYPIPRIDWTVYGKRAGHRRNERMLVIGRPTFAIAFPGENGTADMVMRLLKAKVPLRSVTPG